MMVVPHNLKATYCPWTKGCRHGSTQPADVEKTTKPERAHAGTFFNLGWLSVVMRITQTAKVLVMRILEQSADVSSSSRVLLH